MGLRTIPAMPDTSAFFAPVTALTDLVLPAATARLILLANHVLSSAPAATERLKAHAGRALHIEVEGWRLPLPTPPALTLCITPAGLLGKMDAIGYAVCHRIEMGYNQTDLVNFVVRNTGDGVYAAQAAYVVEAAEVHLCGGGSGRYA